MITRYVNTASTSGGNGTTNDIAGANRAYATLRECLMTLRTTTLTEPWTVYCEGSNADTETLDHDPMEFTTSTANYIRIVGNNTSGKWDDTKYHLVITDGNVFYNQYASHVRLENIQACVNNTNTTGYHCYRLTTANNGSADIDHRYINCIAKRTGAGSGQVWGWSDSDPVTYSGTNRRINCVAYDLYAGFGTDEGTFARDYIQNYNCTAYGCTYNFYGLQVCVNCLAANGWGYLSVGQGGHINNASDDGSALGYNALPSQTFTFADSANDDFHLAPNDAGARGLGKIDPLSGFYSTDIDGQTRTGNWDIGADQVVVSDPSQSAYRFRNDDGNETGATWAANENTALTAVAGTKRLRIQVDATGDPASFAYQLDYKKNTGEYRKVQVTQPATSLPTYVAAGAIASGTGAITPALPANLVVNDILILFLETADQAISIATANNGTWTEAPDSPISCAATNTATRLTIFWSRYNGVQTAPVTSDSGDHQVGRMIAVRGCVETGVPFDVTSASSETTEDTSGSATGDTTTVANTFVVVACAIGYDPASASTAYFSSWANTDLASVTERIDNARSDGNGGGLGVATGTKAAAGAYGDTTFTVAQNTGKAMWTGALLPIAVVTESVLMKASANITASGDNTTAQLTAPTGSFTTGRMQDDENPADAIDIGNGNYTELEWCIEASNVTTNDVLTFRATVTGSALATYTVSPSWTIGSVGGGGLSIPVVMNQYSRRRKA